MTTTSRRAASPSSMTFRATTWADLARPTPQWYLDAPLGIFIHWGPYSVPAWAEPHGELGTEADWQVWFTHNAYAEWYLNTIRIPGSPAQLRHRDLYGSLSYESFLDMWDPCAFDPVAWAELFARAGADYVVPTTKHHDGVTLWEAPETEGRNTVHRGPRRDLVGEIACATRDAGMRFGVYYSGGLDWHYRPFRPIMHEEDVNDHCRPKDAEYARYCYVHAVDLVARYAPDVFWNDIEWPDEGKHFGEHGLGRFFEYYYASCPDGVVNDRFGGVHQDFLTSEYQHMADSESGSVWENCRGIGLSFGYNRNEGPEHHLSGAQAIRHLVDVVSRGGRLLLDVGPKADGSLPAEQVECLEAMATWMPVGKSELVGARPAGTVAANGWVRLLGHEDHVALVVEAGREVRIGAGAGDTPDGGGTLPEGVDWAATTAVSDGVTVVHDGEPGSSSEALVVRSGGELPVVLSAPRRGHFARVGESA